jgi:hypothetical protein
VEDAEQLRRNVAACRRAGMGLAADDVNPERLDHAADRAFPAGG